MLLLAAAMRLSAGTPVYLLEMGIQGGTAYYVGDVHQHIFMSPRYAFGAHLSYKLDRRWTFTAKSEYSRLAFKPETSLGDNHLISTDLTAEYNFFRFDVRQYDPRIKPITPYIALGLGLGVFGRNDEDKKYFYNTAMYIPFVLGFKWKLSPRWAMKVAWQHQLFLFKDADRLENHDGYNNTYGMNGSNILRNDLTGTLTVSVSCSFARKKEGCMLCNNEGPSRSVWTGGGRIDMDMSKPKRSSRRSRGGHVIAN